MPDLVKLSAHLPEVHLPVGASVVTEGGDGGQVWVLVSGSLEVRKGDIAVNTITHPGALIGEMSTLTGGRHSASVVATAPTVLRHAEDGAAFLESDPAVLRLVAQGLAERLAFVTTYLADLRHQYGDSPGLSMVGEVLQQLAQRQAPPARPGSARDPDPDY
ncbi:MAG: Crp/Fnr family transcriptional regulator [Ilumatobacteraceae bacterium]